MRQDHGHKGEKSGLAAALFMGVAGIFLFAWLTMFRVPDMGLQAVVFPPWVSPQSAFAAVTSHNVRIIRQGATGHILIVDVQEADFAKKIKHKGAWFSVNPLGFGGCNGRGKRESKLLPYLI